MHRGVVFVCAMIVGSIAIAAVPSESSAAPGWWATMAPCAQAPYTFTYDGDESIPPMINAPGVKTYNDSSELNLRTGDQYRYVYASDFTDEASWTNEWTYDSMVPWFPNSSATIDSVYIVAVFEETSATPLLQLQYTVGYPEDWESVWYDASPTAYLKTWDVTDDRTWGNDTFLDSDFKVRLIAHNANSDYYLDYLGVMVIWLYEGGISLPPEPGEDPAETNLQYDFIMQEGGLVAVLTLIGVLGLIATPALTVMAAKRGVSKINLFAGALVAFAFCFTLVMFGFSVL